jgi:hypothetical protein
MNEKSWRVAIEETNATEASKTLLWMLERMKSLSFCRKTVKSGRRLFVSDSSCHIVPSESRVRIIVPHVCYLPLLVRFVEHMFNVAPTYVSKLLVILDYPDCYETSPVFRRCYKNEMKLIKDYLDRINVPFIDCGKQLLLENVYSLATYAFPDSYLLFVDDDYFVRDSDTISLFLSSVQEDNCAICGFYDDYFRRIHTCMFSLRSEAATNNLLLFDNGVNLYSDPRKDTGTDFLADIQLLKWDTCVVSRYSDIDTKHGIHLGHCASEMWFGLPLALQGCGETHCLDDCNTIGDVVSLLRDKYGIKGSDQYTPIPSSIRDALPKTFESYIEHVTGNHLWLSAAHDRT